MNKVSLRKFPYPFNAALTICSDIDGTSFDNFVELHRFINTNEHTPMGQGLNLPIGNSFWMFDQPGNPNAAFSYFEDHTGKKSKYAPIMRKFIQAGILDVMHGFGNFRTQDEFSRPLALRAIDELERHHLKIETWTNHGGVESVQNIGKLSAGRGDIPDQSKNWYHADVLRDYGIHFYWDSEASLKHAVGQDRDIKFSEAHWKSPLFCGFRQKSKSLAKGILNRVDTYYYKQFREHFVPWHPFSLNNELLENDILRDGSPISKFNRFGHGRFDWSDDLGMLIRKKVLKTLVKKQGYLILYIHLGDQRNNNSRAPLTNHSIDALKYLGHLNATGDIWVNTTSRLLKYNLMHKFLEWSFSETEQCYQIFIHGLIAQSLYKKLSNEDLQGLTFQTPGDKDVIVFFEEKEVKCNTNIEKTGDIRFDSIPISQPEWPL